jgi:hypothetical protein
VKVAPEEQRRLLPTDNTELLQDILMESRAQWKALEELVSIQKGWARAHNFKFCVSVLAVVVALISLGNFGIKLVNPLS